MKEWLALFFDKTKNFTLTLNGKEYTKSDFSFIGRGSEKNVYKLNDDQGLCFFIPHKWSTEENWNLIIKVEKLLLDQILALGLRAQRFELAELTIQEPGKQALTIQVLITQEFKNLCQKESLAIYNYKADPDSRIIGNPPDIMVMKERLKDKVYAQKLLAKMVNDYAVALTFSLPISPVKHSLDDSQHFCFELAKDSATAPEIRYMFWDVTRDFSGISLPFVPTLEELKNGWTFDYDEKTHTFSKDYYYSSDSGRNDGIRHITNSVACTMHAMLPLNHGVDGFDFVREVEPILADALDDDMLNQALQHARALALKDIQSFLTVDTDQLKSKLNDDTWMRLMGVAISINDLETIKNIFAIYPKVSNLPKEFLDKLIQFAEKYKNPEVILFLNSSKETILNPRFESNRQFIKNLGFDNHLIILKAKVDEFKARKNADCSQAIIKANELISDLEQSKEQLIKSADVSKDAQQKFKQSCLSAIDNARSVLQKHRGWKEVLAQFAGIFVSCVTIGIANLITSRSALGLFPVRTDSDQKLEALEHAINRSVS